MCILNKEIIAISSIMKIYNRTNFFKHTYCVFEEVTLAEIPKSKPDYVSKSKSSYFFTENGVFRKSNHWGRAANCRWKLIPKTYKSQNEIVAFAKWTDFHPNNETEKLFFIRIDNNNQVTFHHKNESLYNSNDVLRNAQDTSKRIKLINEVLDSETWSKHINYSDFEKLEKLILSELLYTNKSYQQIKKELNGKT